jgi:hypothetical protein
VSRRPWTGAERLRLGRLAERLPPAVLAQRFGRSVKAIRQQLWLLRGNQVPARPEPPPDPQVRAVVARHLAAEIAAARAERATAPLYRGGPLLW